LDSRLLLAIVRFLSTSSIGSTVKDYDVAVRVLHRHGLTATIVNGLTLNVRPFVFHLNIGSLNIVHGERDLAHDVFAGGLVSPEKREGHVAAVELGKVRSVDLLR
jgi:hypothetical protein